MYFLRNKQPAITQWVVSYWALGGGSNNKHKKVKAPPSYYYPNENPSANSLQPNRYLANPLWRQEEFHIPLEEAQAMNGPFQDVMDEAILSLHSTTEGRRSPQVSWSSFHPFHDEFTPQAIKFPKTQQQQQQAQRPMASIRSNSILSRRGGGESSTKPNDIVAIWDSFLQDGMDVPETRPNFLQEDESTAAAVTIQLSLEHPISTLESIGHGLWIAWEMLRLSSPLVVLVQQMRPLWGRRRQRQDDLHQQQPTTTTNKGEKTNSRKQEDDSKLSYWRSRIWRASTFGRSRSISTESGASHR